MEKIVIRHISNNLSKFSKWNIKVKIFKFKVKIQSSNQLVAAKRIKLNHAA